MKTSDNNQQTILSSSRFLIALVVASLLFAAFMATTASMQTEVAQEMSVASDRLSTKAESDAREQEPEVADNPFFLSPDVVTATTYPFTSTSAVALDDMSSGTTQLVAASQDDTASAVTNLGFDYWYDGVRLTQFSVNANGLLRLGPTAVSTGFTNSLASTTDAPKIGAYWEDLCTGTNGKVHFKVTGSAPNRKLIVEWQNMQITRGAGCAGAGNGTFQIWLFETTGIIEFVYGSIQAAAAVDGGYSVGLQSGAATNFASVTTTGNTVSYATANNSQTNAIPSGTAYIFTPNVPSAPTGLNFTGTAAVTTTLNWTDNASNEVGYAIYRSSDGGANYTFLTQTAANANSFTDNTVFPSTTYFYRVFAVTEGALGGPAQNSVTTNAAGNISSTAAGGNWSAAATWVGSVVPTVNDNVTIVNGATVTIDTAAVGFTVTVGTGGSPATLQWDATNAQTLTVGNSVTIATNGIFQSATTGTQTGHVLSVAGDLTNNGILDFSTSANTAGAGINFTSATNNTFSGTGATTDLRTLIVNKGTSSASTVEVTTTNFTVQGVNTDVAGFLTLTNGTLKISGTFAGTNRVFTNAGYTIPATGGFWLNNPNYVVAGQNGSPINNGLLRISLGTFNVGTASGNAMSAGTGAVFTIEGGTSNFSGRLNTGSVVTYTQTGGTINVSTVGNASSLTASFGLTSTSSLFNMSGGSINLVQINSNATAANRLDYQVSSVANVTGGTLNVGTAATTGNAGNFDFHIRGQVPNLVIDNTTNVKNVIFAAQTNTLLNTTIPVGSTVNTQSFIWLIVGTTITNNGTITVPTSGSRFYFLGTGPQTYTGSGTCTIVTASGSVDLTMDNPAGLTIDPASGGIVTQRVNFFRGGITNSNKLTLGNGGVTVGVIQYGLAGGTNIAGNFDQSPIFNIGTGGETVLYAQEPAARTTSFEIPPSRSILNSTINNTNGVVLAGGDLTLTGTLTFTAGNLTTNANAAVISGTGVVARTSGHVIGNLRKTYTAAASKTFEVGTANGYSPVDVNNATGLFPTTFTVAAVQGPHPNVNPSTSIQRYWTLTNSSLGSADLTFHYLATDVLGTEANYKVIRASGTPVSFPTSTVNTGAHTATLTGVSSFSDWTVGEVSAPTAAPASINGQITTTSGAPLAGVSVRLSGARNALAITDAQGNYRFTNIDTDNFYTVTPSLTNYHFSPSSRSFSLLANMTEAVFSGTLDASISGNAIDTPEYFVRQHYLDFLGREPDQAGLNFWSAQLRGCGNDYNCIERRTINVSAAYFLSIEFQATGGVVDGLYRASYGRAPRYAEFMPDTARVARNVIVNQAGWQDVLATNKAEFLAAWVERPEFHAAYDNLTNDGYVDALIGHTGVTFTAAERATLVSGLNSNTLTRAQALRQVAENQRFVSAKFNEAFVRMEYFGYLRRDPDDAGFHFWVQKLNEFDGNFERAEMVKAFIVSSEYRDRFRQ